MEIDSGLHELDEDNEDMVKHVTKRRRARPYNLKKDRKGKVDMR